MHPIATEIAEDEDSKNLEHVHFISKSVKCYIYTILCDATTSHRQLIITYHLSMSSSKEAIVRDK